jgi:hypothetical protein
VTIRRAQQIAISTPFEPSSVFKVITFSCLKPQPSPDTLINRGTEYQPVRRVIHDTHSFVAAVLAQSSNIGAFDRPETGERPLYKYQRCLDLAKTGIGWRVNRAATCGCEEWMPTPIGSLAWVTKSAWSCWPLLGGRQRRLEGEAQKIAVKTTTLQHCSQPPVRILRLGRHHHAQLMEGVVLRGTGRDRESQGYTSAERLDRRRFTMPNASLHSQLQREFLGFAPVAIRKS